MGTVEWDHRRKIFEAELARVIAHNNAGKSWKEGVNKFSAMTARELKVCALMRLIHNIT